MSNPSETTPQWRLSTGKGKHDVLHLVGPSGVLADLWGYRQASVTHEGPCDTFDPATYCLSLATTRFTTQDDRLTVHSYIDSTLETNPVQHTLSIGPVSWLINAADATQFYEFFGHPNLPSFEVSPDRRRTP